MAMPKLTALLLLLLAFIAITTLATTARAGQNHLDRNRGRGYGPGSLNIHQCPGECKRRCGKTRYLKPCKFFCNKCCNKCLCVPPGYYGNKEVCSCYNNWKTQQGGPKCP